MSKSFITTNELLAALARILDKKTTRIPSTRKLSVRAVEDEAGLGDGSAYYYQDVLLKIKEAIKRDKVKRLNIGEDTTLKEKLKSETNIKNKYRSKINALNKRISLMAKEHNELYQQMVMYREKVEELEDKLSLIEVKKLNKMK